MIRTCELQSAPLKHSMRPLHTCRLWLGPWDSGQQAGLMINLIIILFDYHQLVRAMPTIFQETSSFNRTTKCQVGLINLIRYKDLSRLVKFHLHLIPVVPDLVLDWNSQLLTLILVVPHWIWDLKCHQKLNLAHQILVFRALVS